jgi:hypothetical protein
MNNGLWASRSRTDLCTSVCSHQDTCRTHALKSSRRGFGGRRCPGGVFGGRGVDRWQVWVVVDGEIAALVDDDISDVVQRALRTVWIRLVYPVAAAV